MVRRLYDWVLHWADTPYGVPALFLLAFAESSFFPIPPDVLLIALALGCSARSYYFAFICSLGSVLGGVSGYLIGMFTWTLVSPYFFTYIPGFTPEQFAHVQGLFAQYNFWIVFAAGFTPIPYKIFTIGAGLFQVNFPMFLLASAVSRRFRFFLVGGLIHYYGQPIRSFIDKYLNQLTWVFTFLLIGGFLLLKTL